MDKLEEYHQLALLVSNFVPQGTRPAHIASKTKIPLGPLARLFETLDDGTQSISSVANTVGAARARDAEGAPMAQDAEGIPNVLVI